MDKEKSIPASNVVSITTARGAHSAEGKDSRLLSRFSDAYLVESRRYR